MESELARELTALHQQNASALLAFARSVVPCADTAHDAVQESFLRYFVQRRNGRVIENPCAWLFLVARNYLLDRQKSAAARYEFASPELDDIPTDDCNPERIAGARQQACQIRCRLSPRELECVRLRSEGLSYAEIGDTLGIRAGTVGALMRRVHEKLGCCSSRKRAIAIGII